MQIKDIARFIKIVLKTWKKRSLFFLLLFFFLFIINFWCSPYVLNYLQKVYNQKLIFYAVGEPIASLLKFALLMNFLIIFPLIWYLIIFFINFLFPLKKKYFFLFFIAGIILFYSGVIFAYKITLPYGINFLLSFKTEKLEPAISLSHFVNFFSFFLLSFGLIFEIPLLICFLSLSKILNPQKLKKYRKEIFFCVVVLAAIITPTPDIFNMSLLAIPLYILFEVGLILTRFLLHANILLEEPQKGPRTNQPPSQEA
ncbi:MAG: preprotein translocase subunit TatC [Thermodesulfobacteriota bacterium]|nr:MAG: preprotein translocase subunit TatC [Thermodesulfobacteriota bacterium]